MSAFLLYSEIVLDLFIHAIYTIWEAELESEIPVCKINFRFSISLARLNSGKLKLLYFSGS